MKELVDFIKDDEAVGIIEIILILVILIAIVLIFKDKIGKIVTNAFSSINKDSGKILE